MYYVPSKRRDLLILQHYVTPQKAGILNSNGAETSVTANAGLFAYTGCTKHRFIEMENVSSQSKVTLAQSVFSEVVT